MTEKFHLIKRYLQYKFKASSAHGIHSPFVYALITSVLQDERHYYAFDEIDILRKKLYVHPGVISVEDFGAGSLSQKGKERKVSDIARIAGRNKKYGKLLFRLANYFACRNCLELGTSLGLGTSYLAKANTEKVMTIEGDPNIRKLALEHFEQLGISEKVDSRLGNFDHLLDDILMKNPPFDLVFIDGNHRKEPTIKYFEKCLRYKSDNTLFIFDDIHWTKDMDTAWNEIIAHPEVKLSLDLFYFGLVFFRKDFKEKQHFVLKYG